MAEGESLRNICRDPHMPGKTTVMRWLADDRYSDFRDQYAKARELLIQYWADEILDIADDGVNDYVKREGKDGETAAVVDHEHIQRSRLRIDTRKWLMSKLAPRKYGEKVDIEATGKDGAPIVVKELSSIERTRRLIYVLRKALQASREADEKEQGGIHEMPEEGEAR